MAIPWSIPVLAAALFGPAPQEAGEPPVVDATPEARAVVARARALLHGPAILGEGSLEQDIVAVVGGTGGAAAVRTPLRLLVGSGGRDLRIQRPVEGEEAAAGRAAALPLRGSVEVLFGGLLPYPWDSWKGSLDGAGVLHAAMGTPGSWSLGVEAAFDARGLPVGGWNLKAGPDGALRRTTRSEVRWEAAGGRFRVSEHAIRKGSRKLVHAAYEWGAADAALPRRWTVYMEDRVFRFRAEGEPALPAGVEPGVMSYFLDPDPDRLLREIRDLGDALLPPAPGESDRGDLLAVALGAVLRAGPSRMEDATEVLAAAGPGPGRVLLRAAGYAADGGKAPDLDGILPAVAESVRGEAASVRRGLPHPLGSLIPMDDVHRGASTLDRCWMLYFASGDPAALRPIVVALRGLDASVPGGVTAAEVVGGAARWSLVSNARRIPGVRECLERDLAVVPEELRPRLEEVLRQAAEPPAPAGEPGKDPGPPEKR